MRIRSTVLELVAVLVVVACSQTDTAADMQDTSAGSVARTSEADVRRAIDSANARFVDAMNRGDSAAFTANYAPDAIVMPPNAEPWRGREAINKGFAGMMSGMTVTGAKLVTDDVMVRDDLAVETGRYEMTTTPKGGAAMNDKGKYIVVWQRQSDGSWKVVREIFNTDLPPAKS